MCGPKEYQNTVYGSAETVIYTDETVDENEDENENEGEGASRWGCGNYLVD